MPDYDFDRMQAEAVRRAREMQSRARRVSAPNAHSEPQIPQKEEIPSPDEPVPSQPVSPQKSALEGLFEDKERTIILALLVLLSGENANHELLFALLFLLM